MDYAIKQAELTDTTFTRELLDEAVFFQFAKIGAMGEGGGIYFVTKQGKIYHANYYTGDLKWETIQRAFPAIDRCTFTLTGVGSKVPDGWEYVNLGAGNHLIVKRDFNDLFATLIQDYDSPGAVYQNWLRHAVSATRIKKMFANKDLLIQVCDRTMLELFSLFPFEKKTAVISICDSDAPKVELLHQPDFFLSLVFDDVYSLYDYEADDDTIFVSFSERQAKEIASFVIQHKDEVSTIICQCELGQSRSAAVAAAISEWLNGDGIRFFADDRYSPNLYVFRTLYKMLYAGECL